MEPFSISCTTCKARLRVRDPESLGQILACPRCGSMVLVQPPGAGAAPPREAGAPAIATPGGIGSAPRIPPSPSLARETTAAGHAAAHDQLPAAAALGTMSDIGYRPIPDAPPPVAAPPPASVTRLPILPDANWTSPTLAAWRFYGVVFCGAMMGAMLAVGALGLLITHRSGTGPKSTTQVDTRSDTAKPAGSQDLARALTDTDRSPVPVVDRTPVVDARRSAKSGSPTPNAAPAVSGTAGPAPGTSFDGRPGAEPAAAVTRLDPAAQAVEATGDLPPELDGSADGAARHAAGKPVVPPTVESGPISLPEDLLPLPPIDEPALPADPAQPGPRAEPEPWPSFAQAPRSTAQRVDVPARLNDPVAAIEFAEIPLHELLQFVSQLSTIPITVEPSSLVLAGVSPAQPVSVNLRDVRVGSLLSDVLGRVRLDYRAEDGHLVVTSSPDPAQTQREVRYRVSDLTADGAAQREELAERVQRFVDPASWASRGGSGGIEVDGGDLLVRQTLTAHLEAITYFEKLRVARGLPLRSRIDPARFSMATRTVRARAALARPVSLAFPGGTASLLSVLARLEQQAGVCILADWRALEAVSVTPAAQVDTGSHPSTLGEALAATLEPLGASFRALDAGLLQVTTPAALAEQYELEFYPLRAEVLGIELRDTLRTELERLPAQPGVVPPSGLELELDLPSGCLLVRAPQPQQRALADLLGQRHLLRDAP